MNLVAFAHGLDLRMHSSLLLEQQSSTFQISDLGQHRALHDGSAFVVLDVSHPPRFLQGNLLCKALFFEIADGVVVGICEEMHDIGCGFDVVLEMRH